MAQHYDATAKNLLEADPAAWLEFLRLPIDGPVRPIDSELSTVTAAADRVILVEGPAPRIVHIEFQAGRDASLARRLLWYNALIGHRHDKPVQSVAILLRKEADTPGLDGLLTLSEPDGRPYLTFRYRVMRVWQQPVESFLAGPLATLPLAAISDAPAGQLPEVLRRMAGRLDAEADRARAAVLAVAAEILIGLRLSANESDELFRGAFAMIHGIEESSVIQGWLARGRAEGRAEGKAEGQSTAIAKVREGLMTLGATLIGPPRPETIEAVEKIDDPDRITYLLKKIASAKSWEELLDEAGPAGEPQG